MLWTPVKRQRPTFDMDRFEKVDYVNFKEIDADTLVYVRGMHPSAQYTFRVVGDANEKKLNIWICDSGWTERSGWCFEGPLDKIGYESLDWKDEERGALKVGCQTFFPYFTFNGDRLVNNGGWADVPQEMHLNRHRSS